MDFVGVKHQVVNKKLQISGILKKSTIDFIQIQHFGYENISAA